MNREDEQVHSSGSSVSSYDLLDSPPSEPFTDVERASEDENIDYNKEETAKLLHSYILQSLKDEKEAQTSFFSPQFSPYYSESEDEAENELKAKHFDQPLSQSLIQDEDQINITEKEMEDSLFTTMQSNPDSIRSHPIHYYEPSSHSIFSDPKSSENFSNSLHPAVESEPIMDSSIRIDPKEEVVLSPSHPIALSNDEANSQIAYVQRYDQTVFWIVKKRENEGMDDTIQETETRALVQRKPEDFFELRLNKKQLSSSLFLSLMLFTHMVAFGAGLLFGRSNRLMGLRISNVNTPVRTVE